MLKSKTAEKHKINNCYCTSNVPILELYYQDFGKLYELNDILRNDGISLFVGKKLSTAKNNNNSLLPHRN